MGVITYTTDQIERTKSTLKIDMNQISQTLMQYATDKTNPWLIKIEEMPRVSLALGDILGLNFDMFSRYVEQEASAKNIAESVRLSFAIKLVEEWIALLTQNKNVTYIKKENSKKMSLMELHNFSIKNPDIKKLVSHTTTLATEDEILGLLSQSLEISKLEVTKKDQVQISHCIREYIKFNHISVESYLEIFQEIIDLSPEISLTILPERLSEKDLPTQLRESISQYEKMIEQFRAEKKDTKGIVQLVDSMRRELVAITQQQKGDKFLDNDKANRDSDSALKEIFYFYSRQQFKEITTFDKIPEKIKKMNFAEFTRFAIDFSIPIKKSTLKVLFKRHASLGCVINWEEFLELLKRIASAMIEEKIESLQNMLEKQSKLGLHPNPETKAEIIKFENMTSNEKIENLYSHLECSNPKLYRRKMKGMHSPFFNKHSFSIINPEDPFICKPPTTKRTATEMKQVVREMKLKRILRQKESEQEVEKKRAERFQRLLSKLAFENEKERSVILDEVKSKHTDSYLKLSNMQKKLNEKSQFVTWKYLKSLRPEEIRKSSDLVELDPQIFQIGSEILIGNVWN